MSGPLRGVVVLLTLCIWKAEGDLRYEEVLAVEKNIPRDNLNLARNAFWGIPTTGEQSIIKPSLDRDDYRFNLFVEHVKKLVNNNFHYWVKQNKVVYYTLDFSNMDFTIWNDDAHPRAKGVAETLFGWRPYQDSSYTGPGIKYFEASCAWDKMAEFLDAQGYTIESSGQKSHFRLSCASCTSDEVQQSKTLVAVKPYYPSGGHHVVAVTIYIPQRGLLSYTYLYKIAMSGLSWDSVMEMREIMSHLDLQFSALGTGNYEVKVDRDGSISIKEYTERSDKVYGGILFKVAVKYVKGPRDAIGRRHIVMDYSVPRANPPRIYQFFTILVERKKFCQVTTFKPISMEEVQQRQSSDDARIEALIMKLSQSTSRQDYFTFCQTRRGKIVMLGRHKPFARWSKGGLQSYILSLDLYHTAKFVKLEANVKQCHVMGFVQKIKLGSHIKMKVYRFPLQQTTNAMEISGVASLVEVLPT